MSKIFSSGQNGRRRRILEFIDKKGFYIALFICIALVGGTTAYIITSGNQPAQLPELDQLLTQDEGNNEIAESDLNKGGLDSKSVTPVPTTGKEEITGKGEISDKQQEESGRSESKGNATSIGDSAVTDKASSITAKDPYSGSSAPSAGSTPNPGGNAPFSGGGKASVGSTITTGDTGKSSDNIARDDNAAGNDGNIAVFKNKISNESKRFSPVYPVQGNISVDYAMDRLIYSKTLDDWRTHSGIDIAAAKGSQVKAVDDGTISEIKNDPRYGYLIIIDHVDGYRSIYANLAPGGDTVKLSQKVRQGDVIGSIGNSASFESMEEAHLHFELLKDGKNINPIQMLPAR